MRSGSQGLPQLDACCCVTSVLSPALHVASGHAGPQPWICPCLDPRPGLFRNLAHFYFFCSICRPCDLAIFSEVERSPGSKKERVRAVKAEGQSRMNAEHVRAKGCSSQEWSRASAGVRVGGLRGGGGPAHGGPGRDGPPETLKGGTWGKVK